MKIQLIASDLDDTLLNPQLELSERTVSVIQAAQRIGIPTVLATNRSYQATLPYIRRLGLSGPVITYGGAQILECATGELLQSLSIPSSLAKRALAFAKAHGVYIQLHRGSDIFYPERCSWSQWYENYIGYPGREVPDLLDDPGDATKLLMLCEAERVPSIVKAAKEEFGTSLWITSSKPTFIEMNHPDANKKSSLERAAAYYGVPREAIIAFGDQPEVDGGMLQYAGMGVAMGNAPDRLKEMVPYTTATNAEDGVAVMLEKLLGLPS